MTNEPPEQFQIANGENHSEGFGKVPNPSETGRKFASSTQRKDTHTISVRDAAKMFEVAGVPRTERSIINWCWPNRQGLARLDSYFDPNDRKYFITQQSIELAIKEELSKGQQKEGAGFPNAKANVPKPSESANGSSEAAAVASPKAEEELRKQILDLNITNRAKDMYIERLHEERKAFDVERKGYIDQLVSDSRQIGELTTRLLQLEGPDEPPSESSQPVPHSESVAG